MDVALSNPIQSYAFKSTPIITSVDKGISIPEGDALIYGGKEITITGKGFAGAVKDNVAFINNTSCTVTSATSTEIKCTTTPVQASENIAATNIKTNPGLRRQVYTLTSATVANLKAKITASAPVLTDEVLLETMTEVRKPTATKEGQYISGNFKALWNGKIRFYVTTSGPIEVILWINETKTTPALLTFTFSGSTAKDDFVTNLTNVRSAYTSSDLVKDNFYFLEIYHSSNQGENHFGLGVEIEQDDVANPNPDNAANKIPEYWKAIIKPDATLYRELYAFHVQPATGTYTLSCGSSGSDQSFDVTTSASVFRTKLASASGQSKLIVRKVPWLLLSGNPTYITGSEDDSSYSTTNFGDMNFRTALNTSSSGTSLGWAFLFLVDAPVGTEDQYIACNFNQGSSPLFSAAKIQARSKLLGGTYLLNLTDHDNLPATGWNLTQIANISATATQTDILSIINQSGTTSFYDRNVEVRLETDGGDSIVLHLRFKLNVIKI
ncbi:MAG: hypothetical protein GY861_05940 [bacterium]|nr:hypothetical protein [bacterium]